MSTAWEPIDHRPPLPRIDSAPRYTPGPIDTTGQIEQQIERFQRAKEAERVWQTVVDAARTT